MIERAVAEKLYGIYERALGVLSEAEAMLWDLPEAPGREEYIEAHDRVVVDILSRLRAPLLVQYHDLDTEVHEGPPDTLVDPDEQQFLDSLTPAQLQRIDDALLSDCTSRWHKVARIVGKAASLLGDEFNKISYGFLAQRIKVLVASGRLQSQGDLDHIRFSEVRLPQDPLSDVVDAL